MSKIFIEKARRQGKTGFEARGFKFHPLPLADIYLNEMEALSNLEDFRSLVDRLVVTGVPTEEALPQLRRFLIPPRTQKKEQ